MCEDGVHDMMWHLSPPALPPLTRLPCLLHGTQDHHDQSQRPNGEEVMGAEKQQVRGVGLQTPTCRRTLKR